MTGEPSNRSEKGEEDQYGTQEARERFEKTLRGALQTPPKPLKDRPKKRDESQRKAKPAKPRKSD